MPRVKQFPRINYHFKRGIKELLTEGTLSDVEWELILDRFGHCCAFCGIEDTGNSRTGLVADHLIPAIEHGDLIIGNAVPACHDCNDLRGKIDWRVFLFDAFPDAAAERAGKIDSYLSEYPYSPPADPLDRLEPNERAEYLSILDDWDRLLARARTLRDEIKRRTKLAEQDPAGQPATPP